MRHAWVVAVLLGAGALAAEPVETDCDSRLECQHGKHAFSLVFDSASCECTEDDMSVFVETPAGRTALPLEKAWYSALENIANGEPVCRVQGGPGTRVSAFAAGPRQVLVFFSRSGRPGYDFVGVALVDAASGKVLDVKPELGASKDGAVAVLKTPRGYKLRLVREHLKEVQCDCPAAFVDEWMSVEAVDGRIRARWMK